MTGVYWEISTNLQSKLQGDFKWPTVLKIQVLLSVEEEARPHVESRELLIRSGTLTKRFTLNVALSFLLARQEGEPSVLDLLYFPLKEKIELHLETLGFSGFYILELVFCVY